MDIIYLSYYYIIHKKRKSGFSRIVLSQFAGEFQQKPSSSVFEEDYPQSILVEVEREKNKNKFWLRIFIAEQLSHS